MNRSQGIGLSFASFDFCDLDPTHSTPRSLGSENPETGLSPSVREGEKEGKAGREPKERVASVTIRRGWLQSDLIGEP